MRMVEGTRKRERRGGARTGGAVRPGLCGGWAAGCEVQAGGCMPKRGAGCEVQAVQCCALHAVRGAWGMMHGARRARCRLYGARCIVRAAAHAAGCLLRLPQGTHTAPGTKTKRKSKGKGRRDGEGRVTPPGLRARAPGFVLRRGGASCCDRAPAGLHRVVPVIAARTPRCTRTSCTRAAGAQRDNDGRQQRSPNREADTAALNKQAKDHTPSYIRIPTTSLLGHDSILHPSTRPAPSPARSRRCPPVTALPLPWTHRPPPRTSRRWTARCPTRPPGSSPAAPSATRLCPARPRAWPSCLGPRTPGQARVAQAPSAH